MNTNELSVEPGQLWRHFKGGICEIITVATHSETKERMVVYKCDACVTDEFDGIWVRPMSMFLSRVDKEKYPDIKQDYRFEPFVGVIDSKSNVPYSKSIREMYDDWVKRVEETDTVYIADIPTESEDDIDEINVSDIITIDGVAVNEVMVKNATMISSISNVEFEEREDK